MTDFNLSLETQYKMISMEATAVSQVLEVLPKKLPAFVSDVKGFISNFMGGDAPAMPSSFFSPEKKVVGLMKSLPYSAMVDVSVFVPAGLSGTYDDYLDMLEVGQSYAEDLLKDTLGAGMRWIAALLSEPENLQRVSGTPEFRKIVWHDLEAYQKGMAKITSKKDASDSAKLGEVIPNVAAWPQVCKRMEEIQSRYASISRTDLIDAVTDLTGALETLMHRAEIEPDVYKLSSRTMKEIADVSYQLAREVEFFSVYSFQLEQMSNALNDTQEHLLKALS